MNFQKKYNHLPHFTFFLHDYLLFIKKRSNVNSVESLTTICCFQLRVPHLPIKCTCGFSANKLNNDLEENFYSLFKLTIHFTEGSYQV